MPWRHCEGFSPKQSNKYNKLWYRRLLRFARNDMLFDFLRDDQYLVDKNGSEKVIQGTKDHTKGHCRDICYQDSLNVQTEGGL